MRKDRLLLSGIVAGSLLLAGPTALVPIGRACAQQPEVSYSEDIAPIFRGWCESCHQAGGAGYEASGLDLTTYQAAMKGTKFGPMIIAGKPDESSLIALLREGAPPEVRMPVAHKPLPLCLRQSIYRWIYQGAKDN